MPKIFHGSPDSEQGCMHSGVRTGNKPDFSIAQAKKSSDDLTGRLIFTIASMSTELKIPTILL
jgi:hypothetical protein